MRVSSVPLLALVSMACGPSARPGDIPPAAPDFARAIDDVETASAFDDDDDDDSDDDADGGGFGGSSADAAFDAAIEAAETTTEAEADEDPSAPGDEAPTGAEPPQD